MKGHPGLLKALVFGFVAALLATLAMGNPWPESDGVHSFSGQPEDCEVCHTEGGDLRASSFCLGCHEGTMGAGVHSGGGAAVSGGNHPWSVRQPMSTEYRKPGPGSAVRLFGSFNDQVECLSCHFAHDRGMGLVIPPQSYKDTCLECHNL